MLQNYNGLAFAWLGFILVQQIWSQSTYLKSSSESFIDLSQSISNCHLSRGSFVATSFRTTTNLFTTPILNQSIVKLFKYPQRIHFWKMTKITTKSHLWVVDKHYFPGILWFYYRCRQVLLSHTFSLWQTSQKDIFHVDIICYLFHNLN